MFLINMGDKGEPQRALSAYIEPINNTRHHCFPPVIQVIWPANHDTLLYTAFGNANDINAACPRRC
jgi:hypothetical protein